MKDHQNFGYHFLITQSRDWQVKMKEGFKQKRSNWDESCNSFWKKRAAHPGFEPQTSSLPCWCSTNWATKATTYSVQGIITFLPKHQPLPTLWPMSATDCLSSDNHLSQCFGPVSSTGDSPWTSPEMYSSLGEKSALLTRIQTLDMWLTKSMLYQLSYRVCMTWVLLRLAIYRFNQLLEKNAKPQTGIEPWTSGLLCWHSTNWATETTLHEHCYA